MNRFSSWPGFVPAIHVFLALALQRTWMPGTSPGMTDSLERPIPAPWSDLPGSANDEFESSGATKQHDGQITKSLSSPFCKNISLNTSGKSVI
jgi:hypothetical protein